MKISITIRRRDRIRERESEEESKSKRKHLSLAALLENLIYLGYFSLQKVVQKKERAGGADALVLDLLSRRWFSLLALFLSVCFGSLS